MTDAFDGHKKRPLLLAILENRWHYVWGWFYVKNINNGKQ